MWVFGFWDGGRCECLVFVFVGDGYWFGFWCGYFGFELEGDLCQ